MIKIVPFDELLREKGLKATPQRLLMLKELENSGHLTVDEVYAEVKKSSSTVSLATIYKNLTSLVEVGIVREVSLEGRKNLYELRIEEHAHYVCTACGAVEDITVGKILDNAVKKITELPIQSAELTIYGKCEKCLQMLKQA